MSRSTSLLPPASALFGLAALFVCVPLAVAAATPAPDQEPAPEHEHGHAEGEASADEGHTELEEAMETLKEGMRHLRRNLTDPTMRAENLAVVRDMQKAPLTAMHHCPEPFEPLDEAGAVAWEVNFKRAQLSLADHLLRLELAIVEERVDDARAIYGSLRDLKSKGHETYDPEE